MAKRKKEFDPKKCGVYVLRWENRDYYYIGSSKNAHDRYKHHLWLLKSNKHNNPVMQNIYNKHGPPVIELFHLCEIQDLRNIEQIYLDAFIDDKCNINMNRQAHFVSYVITDEIRKKMSESAKKRIRSNKTIENWRKYVGLKGSENYSYGTKRTEEYKRHQSELRKGIKSRTCRKVINTETGEIIPYVKLLVPILNITYNSIIRILHNRRKNRTPYRYYDEYLKTIDIEK